MISIKSLLLQVQIFVIMIDVVHVTKKKMKKMNDKYVMLYITTKMCCLWSLNIFVFLFLSMSMSI